MSGKPKGWGKVYEQAEQSWQRVVRERARRTPETLAELAPKTEATRQPAEVTSRKESGR